MAHLVGSYKLVSSENFGEFLKEIGVNLMTRKLAETSKPTVEIKQEGDEFVIKTIAFKNSEIRFKLGQEFEEKRLDGNTVKTVITLEDGKLVQKQFGDKEVTIVREVDGDTLKVVCTSGSVVSTRLYKKE
ncbi:fatty acid-binding protein-like [Argiope bruennichi]|uniref:Fatty acid-binding protein n=1 Tax=Argiope bruennichi TaxID=94029 RepID=A0A8T0FZC4_ARGBR|nr:fatty acid-binding protein-like [Argiope bruennichi]KAF8794233.1 Fatty acid-binding protein like [Argiope bruennichi]